MFICPPSTAPLSCQSLHNFRLRKSVLYPLGFLVCSCHSTARFSNDKKEDLNYLVHLVPIIIIFFLPFYHALNLYVCRFLFDYTVELNCHWKCLFLKHFANQLYFLLVKLYRVCVYLKYYHLILSSGDPGSKTPNSTRSKHFFKAFE